ncbi:MBL fold metallo-hydrolase [Caulobacter sp. CCUG 60055]|nr:MBL fold metallo-hydrolase [Caulobacter sp. CCUG 60055]
MTLTCLGGAGAVTGSRHLLESDNDKLLIDCGLFQGLKTLRLRNWAPFPIQPASIDAVILTHAHLDHCGYLPKLVREGFRRRVIATSSTIDLCEIILRDAAHLQEKDAEYANRSGFSRHHPALPLYTANDAERALKRLTRVAFHNDLPLPAGAQLTFRRAGHILGAATAEIRWRGRTIAFSGDLGRYGDPMMVDPEPIPQADYLVVESTYGDRLHDPVDPTAALGDIIERTTRRGGTVIIPAFAVGRAQLLLYHLWRLRQSGRLGLTPIYLDSPMAIDASDILRRHPDDYRLSPSDCRQACAVATYVRDVEESKAISASPVPKVILSASGMATGGRVLHHIKAFGRDPRNTILFSGFQAAGTRGAALIAGAGETKIHGQWIPIRAEIAALTMLSAHADAAEIVRWLKGFRQPPRHTFIVHGEPSASEALRVRIGRELGWDCTVAEPMAPYDLSEAARA